MRKELFPRRYSLNVSKLDGCLEWLDSGPLSTLGIRYTSVKSNKHYLMDLQIAGGVRPEEFDVFHELIILDEVQYQ